MEERRSRRRSRHPATVLSVESFGSPDSIGDWPCVVCGEPFAVSSSWQINLAGAEPVVSCGRCADHARRNGTVDLPADATLSLNQVWRPDADGPMA